MVIKKWNGSAWVNEYPLVDVDSIVATGTPSSSTFLRGDGAWAVPSGADGNNYLTGVSGSGDGTVTFTRSGLSNLTWNAAHTHSEYVQKNTGYIWTGTGSSALSFRSADTIDTASGDQAALEVYQDTSGADAFMQFHISGDYAKYFGLHGGINDFVVGGWSSGASYQRLFHDGYHPNADKWTTARTLSLTGDVTGSVSWDGSGNASMTTTVADDSHNHIISNVDGLQTALDGKASSSHTHDDRYYTESEVNTLLAGKASTSHTHAYVSDNGDTMTGDLTMDHDGETTENDSHGINFTGRFLSTDFVNKLYMDSNANLKFGTNTIFHSGNDGSSSGLHADLLDGQQGSYYLDYNNLTNTPTDNDTITQIRRDNTGTYRTGNINLVGGTGVTITETASGVFSFAAAGGGATYSSNALYIKRIWSASQTSDEYTLRYNAGTGSGTSVNTTSTWTSIALGYTPSSTDKFMIELSNSTSNSVEKGIAWVGHGTFSSTAGMAVISYDAYETVTSGQLKLAKYFCQYQISGSNMNFRYASKVVY